ncbi:MAG: OsmC family protein [Cardiobacteriaceae bacterium]|nr:OsmC family protein [Cardiobacteriaceae bacterium]
MTRMHIRYEGDLSTRATHQSGAVIETNAPVDNGGKGERFSPTDLLATSLAACACTMMGKKAESMGIELAVHADIEKTMIADPRRVDEVRIEFHFAHAHDAKTRTLLEAAAHACPIAKSLSPDVKQTLIFRYLAE